VGDVNELPPRTATLLLCLRDGTLLGALPPVHVEFPFWQEAGPLVDAARVVHGVDVTVLRLLDAERDDGCGGRVTYLAEVAAPVPGLLPWAGQLDDHPLRLPYARPGGPAADLAWADAVLDGLGRPRTSTARQVRTWNLSSLWRLPTARGAAWLKVVPPFFAHEGQVIQRLDPRVVPPLLATQGPRLLLDEIPGDDLYEATGPLLGRMVSLLTSLQSAAVPRVPELLGLGVADWRAEQLLPLAEGALARTADQLDDDTLAGCRRLLDGLEERFARLDECGVPDTLVHGDFHPGNLRGGDRHLVLLDWGDCGVGHPLLDRAAFLSRTPLDQHASLVAGWDAAWRAAVPGCDPVRAGQLVEPVAALRQAVVYDGFLRGIEPSERRYHAADPAVWLRTAARLAGAAG
jgi:Ser/Thr protein kinase RdoA (MazF antagonist)